MRLRAARAVDVVGDIFAIASLIALMLRSIHASALLIIVATLAYGAASELRSSREMLSDQR